jgi:hypothetical protein
MRTQWELTSWWPKRGAGRWAVRLEFKPADFWVGWYVKRRAPEGHIVSGWSVWICLLPMLPIHLEIDTGPSILVGAAR